MPANKQKTHFDSHLSNVVAGDVKARESSSSQARKPLNGQSVKSRQGSKVCINGATVVTADIEQPNGTIPT